MQVFCQCELYYGLKIHRHRNPKGTGNYFRHKHLITIPLRPATLMSQEMPDRDVKCTLVPGMVKNSVIKYCAGAEHLFVH